MTNKNNGSMHTALRSLVLSTALLLSIPTFGQQADSLDLFDLSLEELMNITVVSSTKKAEKITETPAAITVLTAEEIQFLNFNTLQQVLEYATGLASINGEGGFFTTTTIRGNTLVNYNTNTLLLFDGIPIYNPYHGSFDFQAVPLSSIEKVEIVRGANSVLYGTNAINGVINIVSKQAETRPSGELALGRVRYGTNNTMAASVGYGKKQDDVSFHVFADALSTEGELLTYFDENGNQLDMRRGYQGLSVASNLAYKGFKLHLQYYNREEPAVRTRNFRRSYVSQQDSVGRPVPEVNDENAFVANLEYWHDFSKTTKLHLRSNILRWGNYKHMVDGYWDYESLGVYNDAELHFSAFGDRSSNIAGVSFNRYIGRRFQSQKNNYDIGRSNTFTNDYATYLNGSYALSRSFKVHYGARYYRSSYDSVSLSNFSPRLAFTYRLFKNVYLKTIYGQSFRVPTYFEKEASEGKVIGNPGLSPERSSSFDVLVSGVYKGLQADLGVFYTRIDNRIRRVAAPEDPSKVKFLNIGQIALQGAELNTKFRIKNTLSGFLGYAYTQGINQETGESLEFVYPHMVNFGGIYHLLPQLSLTTSVKYLDDWAEAPAYTLWNVGVNVQPKKDLPFMIEFKADNLLDTSVLLPEIARNQESVSTIPAPLGRQFLVGFSYNFK